ncbi:MAG TPA: hypothetical protein VHX15_07385 [Frankiaceae bacterium]|nr:hypothetical protein [Frankiaceae bacterium]
MLLEQTDEWAEQRRYLGIEVLTKSRRNPAVADPAEEVNVPMAITASNHQRGSRGNRRAHHPSGLGRVIRCLRGAKRY